MIHEVYQDTRIIDISSNHMNDKANHTRLCLVKREGLIQRLFFVSEGFRLFFIEYHPGRRSGCSPVEVN